MGYLTRGATAGGKTYDLLSCPHCGGEAEFRDGSSTKPYIRCKECGCRTWGSYAYDNLVAAWNRRAGRTCRVECYPPGYEDNLHYEVCSECGTILTASRPGDRHAARASYCPNCGARVVRRGE